MKLRTLFISICTFLVAGVAFANDGAATGASPFSALAAGLGMAIASFGGAMAQAKAASAALEGISRNPAASGKVFVPMIIALALMESLVLLTFLIINMKV